MGNEIFKKCLEFVLQFEGGYVNHPNDPGGETNKGIIKTEYDKYRHSKNLPLQSVKLITEDEVQEIYFNNYWVKNFCDQMPVKIALIHFDTSVNCGVRQAGKFLQRALGVSDDGFIGPATLKKLKEVKDTIGLNNLSSNYLNQRKNYYIIISEKNPKLKVFLKGWNNRVSALEKIINKL